MNTPSAPADTILVCIDMQPVFVRAVAEGERVQRRCHLALAAAAGLGLPVVFTEQVPTKLGGTEPTLAELAPSALRLGKTTFSALADPAIRNAVMSPDGPGHLLLCGVETPICVYQTACDARAEGFTVTVLADAVGARRPDDATACLAALRHAGVHVLPTETVFYALLHHVPHPFFKAFTQLVKSHA